MKFLASNRGGVIILIIMVAAVSLMFGYSYWEGQQKLERLSAEAPAVVTSVYVSGTRSRRGGTSYQTDLTYSYVVNGKTLSGQTKKAGDVRSTYQRGMRAKACYDPSNPAESEVFPLGHHCGQ